MPMSPRNHLRPDWMLAAVLSAVLLVGCRVPRPQIDVGRWFGEMAVAAAEGAFGRESNAAASDEAGLTKAERHRRWEQETQQAFLRKSRRPWTSPKTQREQWQQEIDAALAR